MPFRFDNSYARLPSVFYARVLPTPVRAPELIALNRPLADLLGVDPSRLGAEDGLAFLSGNRVPDGADPIALAYSGHQFGGFSPQLGDGRAILLGEVIGRDNLRRDIQLKGSGPTPFSRRGDGRSALGPVLREYLVSEAMAALGVPTTRALAAVSSGEPVFREALEPGAVFTRIASSHLRIGTFEYFASRQDLKSLRLLTSYAINRHFPEASTSGNPPLALLERVIARQATLLAQWMSLGFIHGVMNTDNTSISGETLDYGPCAFLDSFDPSKKFSFIDQQGRYAYENQPRIAHWNLARLAESLLPLLASDGSTAISLANNALERFPDLFRSAHLQEFTAKIGIPHGLETDWPLVQSLLDLMSRSGVDFTLAFRHLRNAVDFTPDDPFPALFPDPAPALVWLSDWRSHLASRGIPPETAAALMSRVNPVFIPRNHRIEETIQAGRHGDFLPFHRLNDVLAQPFKERPDFAAFESPPSPHEVVTATFCGT